MSKELAVARAALSEAKGSVLSEALESDRASTRPVEEAEAALARALAAHQAWARTRAHSLLAEAFSVCADLQTVGHELHVRLDPLPLPRQPGHRRPVRRARRHRDALPGTQLRLVYSVNGH